jgi:hypothetical protein
LLEQRRVNYVLMGTCPPDMVAEWKQDQMILHGNILTIRDVADVEFSGSCEELFVMSEGKGLGRHAELVLQLGTGHGVLYHPLEAWITPAVEWARQGG